VRWTRIEEAVIMDWSIQRNEPGSRNCFQRELSSQSCPGRPGIVTIPSTDDKSPIGGISIDLPTLLDVGSIS